MDAGWMRRVRMLVRARLRVISGCWMACMRGNQPPASRIRVGSNLPPPFFSRSADGAFCFFARKAGVVCGALVYFHAACVPFDYVCIRAGLIGRNASRTLCIAAAAAALSLLFGSAPDKRKGPDKRKVRDNDNDNGSNSDNDDRAAAIISWRGATVALSRELVEIPPEDARSDESDAPGSPTEGSASLLEPLLPSGAAAAAATVGPVLPGRGRDGTVPGFSVENVSLEVRRGEVRQRRSVASPPGWVVFCKTCGGCSWLCPALFDQGNV